MKNRLEKSFSILEFTNKILFLKQLKTILKKFCLNIDFESHHQNKTLNHLFMCFFIHILFPIGIFLSANVDIT